MVSTPITKILFLDIETVGGCPDYDSCQKFNPEIASQFEKYFDWFLKRFPEDSGLTKDEVFTKRAALVPEFAKIVCISVAFVLENGETKKDPSIIRFEQIYPFPKEALEVFLKENDGIKEILWVQEEPQNMGAWNFIYYKFTNTFGSDIKLRYVGRKHSGSTAEGSLKAHQLEQKRIVTEAFS